MENFPTVLLTENITGYLAYIDPQGSTVLIIFLLIFICFSFIASGAEVAFFSLSYKDINLLKTKKQHSYKRVVDLLEHPKELLASLLIANSFCNIAIIIIFNILLGDITTLSFWAEFALKVVSVTVLLVLFCEVMPKIFARNNNIRFAKDFGIVIEGIYLLFRRPGKFLVNYSDMIERRFSKNASASYRKEEIYDAIDITTPGDDENAAKEKDILKGIVKFSNTTVKQVMKSRLDVSGIEYDDSFEELMHKISELHYSRLPVYKEDLDAVTGLIHTKDVLPFIDSPADFDWHTLMRQPYFVHEQKLIEDLLQEFQQKRIHFAVVVDEFGGTSGIVTLEDIMEEVIGDIKDEFDEEEAGFKKLDENNYVFDGLTMINDVCKFMELPSETFDSIKGESDTLAGLVLEMAGEIPKPNDVIQSGDFDFTVLELAKNRLQKIKVTIKPQDEQ